MAKPRKSYSKTRPLWQWILFYILIGSVIYSLLYYSGMLGFGSNQSSSQEIEYYE